MRAPAALTQLLTRAGRLRVDDTTPGRTDADADRDRFEAEVLRAMIINATDEELERFAALYATAADRHADLAHEYRRHSAAEAQRQLDLSDFATFRRHDIEALITARQAAAAVVDVPF